MSNPPSDRAQLKKSLIDFLRTIQRPDRPIETLNEEQSLVEAGLIDSLAVLQIVLYLEQTYGIDFRETGLDPGELSSVRTILDVIERQAK
jgi:acyl carrier protein